MIKTAALLVGAAALAVGAAADDAREAVVTLDGREIVGPVRRLDRLRIVETGDADIYITDAAVRSARAAEPAEPEPVYLFNQDRVRGPKRGPIRPTVDRTQLGPLQPDGTRRALFSHPEQGPIELTLAITRIAPTEYRHEAIEYEYANVHPLAALRGADLDLIRSVTPEDDAAAQLKAATFFRMAGRFAEARAFLERAQSLAPDRPLVAAERRALLLAEWRTALARAESAAEADRMDDAERALEALSEALPAHLAERRDAVRRAIASARAERRALEDSFPARAGEIAELLPEVRRRAAAALAGRAAAERGLADGDWPLLLQPWAEALAADPGWRADHLRKAGALAAQVAAFFAAETAAEAPAVARALEASELPFAVRWAILRLAPSHAPRPRAEWDRVEFRNPFGDGVFHYFIRTPREYRPEIATPAVLALHGQAPMADSMLGIWGPVADRLGWILISPEYIYGRRAGYRGNYDELDAVMGALHHAARDWNIDLDRVFLTGFSQGGHATWDMGAAHAARFAGIAPFIGHPPPAQQFTSFRDTALYAVGGEKDFHSPGLVRPAMAAIAKTGAAAMYVEYRGRGHELYFEEYPALIRWMLSRRRQRDGDATVFCLAPTETRRDWLEILEPVRGWPPSRRHLDDGLLVEGRHRGQTIELDSANVRSARVYFSPDLLDLGREVRIVANGRLVFSARPPMDWRFALEDAHRRRDRLAAYVGAVDVRLR